MSERQACRVVKQPRGTQRYRPTQRDDEDTLTLAIVTLASQYGRYGYRRMTAAIRGLGETVNHKTVQRLMIEYDGQEHLTPQRAARDLRRQAYLSTAGWEALRFLAKEVFQPALVAARVRAAIARRVTEKHRSAVAAADR